MNIFYKGEKWGNNAYAYNCVYTVGDAFVPYDGAFPVTLAGNVYHQGAYVVVLEGVIFGIQRVAPSAVLSSRALYEADMRRAHSVVCKEYGLLEDDSPWGEEG